MRRYVTHVEFREALEQLEERMEQFMEASQDQINALTAELGTVSTDLANATAVLQSELDGLVAANPGVDITALQAAADALDPAVQKLAALAPTPPPVPPAA